MGVKGGHKRVLVKPGSGFLATTINDAFIGSSTPTKKIPGAKRLLRFCIHPYGPPYCFIV
jgi:hypothetical protein